jgi:hypothetical protein
MTPTERPESERSSNVPASFVRFLTAALFAARRGSSLRSLSILFVGLVAAYGFLSFVGKILPLGDWVVWDLLVLAGWQLFLAAAFVSGGHLLVTRVFGVSGISDVELASFSLATGALLFALAMYLGGFLGLYGAPFAVTLPLSMIAAGARSTWGAFRASLERWRAAPPPGPLVLLAYAFGAVCIALAYLCAITPDALTYDATWYHLVIAQDYAREGRIVPFYANWVMNLPHLASVVNTWGFLLPGLKVPALRWMMALQIELAFVIFTLVHVSALARWFAGDRPVPAAWVVFWLFPAVFIDAWISGWADRYLAFFAAPILLAALRATERSSLRGWALFGCLAAGALLTKLQAIYLLVPVALLVTGRLAWKLWRERANAPLGSAVRGALVGPLVALGCALLLSAPHFGMNWIFYKNPLYPVAQHLFAHSRPSVPDIALQVEHLFGDWRWRPPPDLADRIRTALSMVFTFSFEPHYTFMAPRPSFGSLFTLSLGMTPFVVGGRRLWSGVFVSLGALFAWAFTFWVDRHIQGFTPILIATTAGTLALAWRTGWLARAGVVALVAAQLAWNANIVFVCSDRLVSSLILVRATFDGRAPGRYDGYLRPWVDLGKAVPRDGVLVLHNFHTSLGIDRKVLLDWIGFQGLIDYRTFRTPRDLYDRFRALGVTHVVLQPGSHPAASKQEEAIFAAFYARHLVSRRNFGGLELAPMPTAAPPVEAAFRVLTFGIPGYADGVYGVEDLSNCEELPPALQRFASPRQAVPTPDAARAALAGVDVALLATGALAEFEAALQRDFLPTIRYGHFAVYVRRR